MVVRDNGGGSGAVGSLPSMAEIFNDSQHVTNSDQALNQIKRLYKIMPFDQFEEEFRLCVRKLFQSKQTIYFKTSCDFLCKFLQYLSKLSDEIRAKAKDCSTITKENTCPAPRNRRTTRNSVTSISSTADANVTTNSTATTATTTTTRQTRGAASKRGTKRKEADYSDDELIMEFLPTSHASMQTDSASDEDPLIESAVKRRKSTISIQSIATVNNHDRTISACIDVADMYMGLQDEECRLNGVFFVSKFMSHVNSLDDGICDFLKDTLPLRVRDKKSIIRTHAVLASRTFQDTKMTQEAFRHHFVRDPDIMVRKALLQIMDPKYFGTDFLVDSTQESHESMRKAAFLRLGKLSPKDLDLQQLHRVIHNGLTERDQKVIYTFKAHTLEPWLAVLYDGVDLHKLLQSFDVLNYRQDICRILEEIYTRDREELQNNGTTTKLHRLVESFRDKWLDNSCLPNMSLIDENLITVWLTLYKFCKTNQSHIKSIKIRTVEPQADDPNQSIEKILDSQERNDEDAELYERLQPDLVNLVDFLKRFVYHADQASKSGKTEVNKLEFIYHHLIQLISSYEIGDELERKTVQEVFGNILNENLLTGRFDNFITPIIKCLYKLIYSTSSNLMINYISELINNVRSHLEDLATSTMATHSTIMLQPSRPSRSAKKVRINAPKTATKRHSQISDRDLEFKIANIRVDLEELKDKYDDCLQRKDFDGAKVANDKIDNLKAELNMLHGRRSSLASDISDMSMIIETEPTALDKLSSTMIGDSSLNGSSSSPTGHHNKDEIKIFKHHTNELLKCLQMYFGCLESVQISEVPQTMLNHLNHLNYESLDEWFMKEARIRSLMVACNGLTGLVDKNFAKQTTTIELLVAATHDQSSIEVRTVGFKGLVDIICQHDDLDVPMDKIENFLRYSLRDYDRYNLESSKKNESESATAIVEGSAKLFYMKKICSPHVLSHLIILWYHPKTDSRLKQFIGIFLPTFVGDISKKQIRDDVTWLEDLLEETFVCSIKYLHDYILGRGSKIMGGIDMHSLVNFLCNLIPISHYPKIAAKVDEQIDCLTPPNSSENKDLLKYLKQSKNNLVVATP